MQHTDNGSKSLEKNQDKGKSAKVKESQQVQKLQRQERQSRSHVETLVVANYWAISRSQEAAQMATQQGLLTQGPDSESSNSMETNQWLWQLVPYRHPHPHQGPRSRHILPKGSESSSSQKSVQAVASKTVDLLLTDWTNVAVSGIDQEEQKRGRLSRKRSSERMVQVAPVSNRLKTRKSEPRRSTAWGQVSRSSSRSSSIHSGEGRSTLEDVAAPRASSSAERSVSSSGIIQGTDESHQSTVSAETPKVLTLDSRLEKGENNRKSQRVTTTGGNSDVSDGTDPDSDSAMIGSHIKTGSQVSVSSKRSSAESDIGPSDSASRTRRPKIQHQPRRRYRHPIKKATSSSSIATSEPFAPEEEFGYSFPPQASMLGQPHFPYAPPMQGGYHYPSAIPPRPPPPVPLPVPLQPYSNPYMNANVIPAMAPSVPPPEPPKPPGDTESEKFERLEKIIMDAEKKRAEEAAAREEASQQERAKKAAEEAAKRKSDAKQVLHFKDAVGRKFKFPFHQCKTWEVCSIFNSQKPLKLATRRCMELIISGNI